METSMTKIKFNRPLRVSKEDQERVVESYLRLKSITKVRKEIEFCQETIAKILAVHGINQFNHYDEKRNRKINQNYFEKIDTEEKAYWLGFIAADGYVSHENSRLTITLSSIDKDHLIKFQKALETDNPIRDFIKKSPASGKPCPQSIIGISSRKMITDLERLGIIQKKSLVLKPPLLSDEMILPFIRGYFDGDGGYSRHRVKRRSYSLQTAATFTGTKEVCEFISDFLKKYELNPIFTKRFKDETNNYTLMINGNLNVAKVSYILYKNATIFMNRKVNEFKEMFVEFGYDTDSQPPFSLQYRKEKGPNWNYWINSDGVRHAKYGFKTKQECFEASLEKMMEIGHKEIITKNLETNKDCFVTHDLKQKLSKTFSLFYLEWVELYKTRKFSFF
jgi:hypothetical protein